MNTKDCKTMFSSEKDDWATPQWFFDQWNSAFNFTLDVCASDTNHKCDRYFTKEDDGLSRDWSDEVCWMNPPYGKDIGKWMKKALQESFKGAKIVCLLPARTDTRWFHDYVYGKAGVRIIFLKGRLKFEGAKSSAPFPSMVVIYNG